MIGNTPKLPYPIFLLLSVGLLGITGDITLSWSSPVIPKLKSNDSSINPLGRPITDEEDSWIGSLAHIGAMIGTFPFGFIAEKYGRKVGLLSVSIPQMIAFLSMASFNNIYIYYASRLLAGLSLGACYSLLPMYVAEIAEDSKRGMYSAALGIFWSLGEFLPFAVGPFLSFRWFNIAMCSFAVLFFVSFLIIGKETPYYLVGANKCEEAAEVLKLLRSLELADVEQELRHIKATVKNQERGHLCDIIKNKGLRKAFIISELLIIFNQLCGSSAIMTYLQLIFEESGSRLSADISALVPNIFSLIFSIALALIVENYGRKTLFIHANIIMIVPLATIGTFFYIKQTTNIDLDCIFWLPVVSIIFYYFAYGMGVNVLPWTISSELFPKNVKQVAAASVSTTCWLTSFLITWFFNKMEDGLGTGGTFWFFASCCLLAAVFTAFFVPETKGKTFMEIQEMIQKE